MKKTLKNIAIINMINTLNQYGDKKLPQKISYAIYENIVSLKQKCDLYEKQLSKIVQSYSDHFVKDDKGEIQTKMGIPVVDTEVSDEYLEQIGDLLDIDVEVEIRNLDKSIFDYDDKGIYDILTPKDNMMLQSILCAIDEEETKE